MINLEHNENFENEQLVEVDNKEWVDRYFAFERLCNNPDFNLLILEGYLREHATNQVSMLAHPSTVRMQGARSEIMESLISISRLRDYFSTVVNLGKPAEDEDETGN